MLTEDKLSVEDRREKNYAAGKLLNTIKRKQTWNLHLSKNIHLQVVSSPSNQPWRLLDTELCPCLFILGSNPCNLRKVDSLWPHTIFTGGVTTQTLLGSHHSTTSREVTDKPSKTMHLTHCSRGGVCEVGDWSVTATKVAFVCCLQHHLKCTRSVQDLDIFWVLFR